ncbi:hypothetical protein Misp01_43390 [Microtetraspora sp. NBRC 13810]|uniref:DUF5996 family protein n=1 Tax=Microtetraspora sp. NBRC 13810 TaxID=3030990 RepID=UPI0024A5CD55|nr:DUF5996 family protein [Microtetraspora sp. NBRC 13810]GLW09210.1 hypothetical protein Misp01_43390 [Microtetraspora sp. NBRC 13810]
MEVFPAAPAAGWQDTKATLHRFAQVVGKIRLASGVRRNHWWHVPFHLTGRGLTTRPMGLIDGNPIFTIDFDFAAHRLVVAALDGRTVSFPLQGRSVASFYHEVLRALAALDVRVEMDAPHPFDLPDADRPFAQDTEHAAYDPAAATWYWRVLSQVNLVLEEYAAGFSGKTSPVHHFWHTFDIACSRFGDRVIGQPPDADPVTREAYSREVISSGFWFGDESPAVSASVPPSASPSGPAFYSYTAPEPEGLTGEPLLPAEARWTERGGGHLAVLPYDDARAADDPRCAVLEFYESAYRAGARCAKWDIARLACPGGITDPWLRTP